MMTGIIENKLIIKRLKNTFGSGEMLFEEIEFSRGSRSISNVDLIKEIVKKIRFSKSCYLALKEKCLASMIVSELTWAYSDNKNLQIKVKSQELKTEHMSLSKSIEVDVLLECNLITIVSDKTTDYYLIDYDYFNIDGKELFDAIWNNKKQKANNKTLLQILNKFDKPIYIVDDNKELSEQTKFLLKECKRPLVVFTNTSNYNNAWYEHFLKLNTPLILGNAIRGNLLISKKEDKFFKIQMIKEVFVEIEISGQHYSDCFAGELFCQSKLPKVLDNKQIGKDKFILSGMQFVPYELKELKTINNYVEAKNIDSFIAEDFDKSFYDKHNNFFDYIAVEYHTDFAPPLLEKTATISDKYAKVLSVAKKALDFYGKISSLKQKSREYVSAKCVKDSFISELVFSLDNLFSSLKIGQGRDLHWTTIESIVSMTTVFEKFDKEIIKTAEELFGKENEGVYDEKSKRILSEIEQKTTQIKEFTSKLNDPNENKIRINRRIDDIKDEIVLLQKLFEKQVESIKSLSSEDLNVFIKKLKTILSEKNIDNKETKSDSSFGKVLDERKVENKALIFETNFFEFVRFLIFVIKQLIKVAIDIVAVNIPKAGVLFEENGNYFVAIKRWNELDTAKIEAEKRKAEIVIER